MRENVENIFYNLKFIVQVKLASCNRKRLFKTATFALGRCHAPQNWQRNIYVWNIFVVL